MGVGPGPALARHGSLGRGVGALEAVPCLPASRLMYVKEGLAPASLCFDLL